MTIQSAIYLAGNKRKLFDSIYPHLLGRSTLIDLFTGSGTVSLNCAAKCEFKEILSNDKLTPLYELHCWLQRDDLEYEYIEGVNKLYAATKDEYLRLRQDYNDKPTALKLLLLQYRSNSNMMRWSSRGFNVPYGERQRFDLERIKRHNALARDIKFFNHDFADMLELVKKEYEGKESEVVIYIDSPYFGTTAIYNQCDGWTENDNQTLFEYADYLHDLGFKIVMSNVFSNRGVEHTQIQEWLVGNDRYDVHRLDIDYSNSSFRKSEHKTDEVLIVSREER